MNILKDHLGRAIKSAYLSIVGRDYLVGAKADHLFISMPKPPKRLVDKFRDLTGGLIGTVLEPADKWGIVSLRELSPDWEEKYNRFILETYVIQIVAACDSHIHTIVSDNIKNYLISRYPEFAPKLLELRAMRNCLLHSSGLVDRKYITDAGSLCRSESIGTFIPLDWSYAYDRTLVVLDFAYSGNST